MIFSMSLTSMMNLTVIISSKWQHMSTYLLNLFYWIIYLMILGPLLLFITGVLCYPPQAFCPPVPLLLSLSTSLPPSLNTVFVVVFSQWIYKLHNNWKEHKCQSLFFSLHMEPPKFNVQGYLSFLLYLHNRVQFFCKAVFFYVSVYLSVFKHSIYTWPIASQDSVSLGALTEHHRRNILLTLIRVRLWKAC